jgi:hypothetical protein
VDTAYRLTNHYTMNIIKAGVAKADQPPPTPWWIGQKARCRECGCEAILEVGDPVEVPDYMLWAATHPCITPNCDGELFTSKP